MFRQRWGGGWFCTRRALVCDMRSGVENPHLPEVTDFAQAGSMEAKARPTRGQVTGARGRC